MRSEALERIRERLGELEADALWVEASVNLRYLTGLDLLALKRPCGLLIPARGEPRMLVPLLLHPETAELPVEQAVWADHEGYEDKLGPLLSGLRRMFVAPALPTFVSASMRALHPALEIEIDPGIMAGLRARKDARELDALRRAARLADETTAWIATQRLEGWTERRLDTEIAIRFLRAEAGIYPYIVATGANAALPHHVSADVPIVADRPLLTDFGCVVDGYHSDMTRVHFPEALDGEIAEAYEVVLAAYDAAFAALAPDVPCEEVDQAARRVIEEAGHGEHFLSRTGHGIGLEIHEEPYLRSGGDEVLEVGNVFSVEPSIAVPGRFGLRYENIVHLGADGPEALNAAPRFHTLRG